MDTGPREDQALAALEAGLRRAGVRAEDLELILVTHHHLDHSGLAATLAARSGATVAAMAPTAVYGEHYAERSDDDRRFSDALMRHHGVPQAVIDEHESFWAYIRGSSEAWHTDRVLGEGERIRAGDRDLRVVARPGHSTTDTLFVDDRDRLAFVGDHLLASVSSNTEIYPAAEPDGTRPRARRDYLASLRLTAATALDRLLSGHGQAITAHADLIDRRFAEHRRRCERILAILESTPATAYEIATHLWSARTVAEQPLLVVWEVLGHLDLLLDAGVVAERVGDHHSRYGIAMFASRRPPAAAGRGSGAGGSRPGDHEPTTLREGAAMHEPAEMLDRRPADHAASLFGLSGRVAVVTGATRGLGLAIGTGFARAGAEVVVVSRNADACEEVAASLRAEGGKAIGCACHVGRWDCLERLVERVYDELGRIDVLVNNAGISPLYDRPADVSEELFDKVIAVNLKGPFRLAALVGQRMMDGNGGSIINVSSTGAVRPTSDIIPYAAAKAGVNAITVGLADAFGPRVRVNALMPGPFLTSISSGWDMDLFEERAQTFPLRRAGAAEEIVGAALYLASDASSFTTGTVLTVDGGAQWSMPGTGGDRAAARASARVTADSTSLT